ncbi:MAG: hypothetical protein ACIALR_02775 [Blastopirellula sp. JB062]
MNRKQTPRRGAILLVVLSVLVLFALVGVTFVVTAGQFKRAADAGRNHPVVASEPQQDTDAVMLQVLRGPKVGTPSVLIGSELLRDLYGRESRRGVINTVEETADDGDIPQDFLRLSVTADTAFVPTDGYYNGGVLTYLDGDTQHASVRIIGYDSVDTNGKSVIFLVEKPTLAGNILPADGDRILVNGRPFSGTGFGYSDIGNTYSSGASLDLMTMIPNITTDPPAADMRLPVALLPNFAAYTNNGKVADPFAGDTRYVDHGGADEPWDAPDYQNMALSYYFNDGNPTSSEDVLPSFHRPDLMAYWYKKLANEWREGTDSDGLADLTPDTKKEELWIRPYGVDGIRGNADDEAVVPFSEFPLENRDALVALKRRISLRPLREDNPNFTGSNTAYRDIKVSGSTHLNDVLQWDVDNDRDGIMDSVWIDPGLPVMTAPDGRRYKKLAAILVKDQDARLNLNASGFFNAFDSIDTATDTYDLASTTLAAENAFAAGGTTMMPRLLGAGYGPADFNLHPVFSSNPRELYNIFNTRYGGDGASGLPGVDENGNQGNDRLEQYTEIGLPSNWGGTLIGQAYGTYPLIADAGVIYLDYSGRSRVVSSAIAYLGDPAVPAAGAITNAVNDPYELNLTHPQGTDAPFTPGDLEALARYNDYDGNYLSARIKSNAPQTLSAPANRAALTTESFSMQTLPPPPIPLDLRATAPTPPFTLTAPFLQNQITRGRRAEDSDAWQNTMPTIIDLARERIRRNLPETLNGLGQTAMTEAQVEQIVRSTLPFEVLRGEPMDVNRLFNSPLQTAGDAFDRDVTLPNLGTYTPQYLNDYNTAYFNSGDGRNVPVRTYGGTDDTQFESTLAKQLYARHLFCLALLLHDAGYDFPPFESVETFTGEQSRELTVRRLAQWAINVVDFRDNDAIMTPFEYDVNPWDGWGVDGDLLTDETSANYVDRRIVWGAEQPDLLITETLNTHDRRVKDTDYDDSAHPQAQKELGNGGDATMDQYRIPQGSSFIELYAVRNLPTNGAKLPGELYDLSTNELLLGAVAPNNAPVWRMAVTKHQTDPEKKLLAQVNGAADRVNTVMFQPNDPTPSGGVNDPAFFHPFNALTASDNPSDQDLEIDRMIWFTNAALPNTGDDSDLSRFEDISFKYRGGANLRLAPNRYLVAGPRPTTYFGSAPDENSSDPAKINITGSHRIQLATGTAPNLAYDTAITADTYPTTAAIQNVICGIFTAPIPDAAVWPLRVDPDELNRNGANADVGLNISEPLPTGSYYTEPLDHNNDIHILGHYSEANPTDDLALPTTLIPDEPMDSKANTPLEEAGALETNTYNDFKGLLLQRLADPTRDYHPAYNPYITVDFAPLDLQVFNGEDHNAAHPLAEDPDDTGTDADLDQRIRFASVQRGIKLNDPLTGEPNGNLLGWIRSQSNLAATGREFSKTAADGYAAGVAPTPRDPLFVVGGQQEHFGRPLKHSLGYLNRSLGTPLTTGAGTNAEYVGSPGAGPNDMPFGFLYWPDSPFMSAHDLMLVPTSAPQRLTLEYSLFNGDTNLEQYGATDRSDAVEQATDHWGRFGGLMNFYNSRDQRDLGTINDSKRRAHMYRLFDYVTVPSRFVGTQKYYRAATYEATTTGTTDLKNHLRFPFNKRSEFRDPGTVNLNTMGSGLVYNGLFQDNYFQDANVTFPSWGEFQQSRAGSSGGNRFSSAAADFPSWFSDPFRPAAAANMMPPLDPANPASAYNNALRVSGVDATVLRSKKLLTDSGNTAHTIGTNTEDSPLFEFETASTAATRFTDSSISAANRLQGIRRLDNLTTEQSNVYAVWVTLGYFEVEPTTIDGVHPDGWRLGQELGSDTGEITRHRSFYLIDRSIPVGFEPGEDHNVEDAVLLKRRID